MKRKELTASEMGKMGGEQTKARHDSSFYSEIAKIGRETVKKDPEYYYRLSQAGVKARQAKKAEKARKDNSIVSNMTKLLIGE